MESILLGVKTVRVAHSVSDVSKTLVFGILLISDSSNYRNLAPALYDAECTDIFWFNASSMWCFATLV